MDDALLLLILGLVIAAGFVLRGIGMHTIAKRRGIKVYWLSWVPIINIFVLGAISDRYQKTIRGVQDTKRWFMLTFSILLIFLLHQLIVNLLVFFGGLFLALGTALTIFYADGFLDTLQQSPIAALLSLLAVPPVGISCLVLYFMSLHDLYRSCQPKNAALYLVLSIFLPFMAPLFIFLVRGEDGGMPIRRPAPVDNGQPIPLDGTSDSVLQEQSGSGAVSYDQDLGMVADPDSPQPQA